ARAEEELRRFPPRLESAREAILERAQLAGVRRPRDALERRGVEEDRRRREQVEDEDEEADQQDDELHRHLEEAVEEEAEPALRDRAPRQVALHLRLVGAEIGEREEEAAGDARPEIVAIREAE